MATRQFNSIYFGTEDEQTSLVEEWQARYYALVGRLGHIGTEVRVVRTLERDKDIKPYTFVRNAYHEFIFPPQGVMLIADKPTIPDPTPGYALQHQDRTYGYDPSLVSGRIIVAYDDASNRVSFTVTDDLEISLSRDLATPVLDVVRLAEVETS